MSLSLRGKPPISIRVNRIARKRSAREDRRLERQQSKNSFAGMVRPMRRKETPKPETVAKKLKTIIAYDLETTNIARGTPRPLYLTACGADFWHSGEILGIKHLGDVLTTQFLTPELNGARFVAWNGNRFDIYFVALALLKFPELLLRPYLTRSKNLRGLRVILRQYDPDTRLEITGAKGIKEIAWEFLDGMSMTGIQKPLADFLKTFAPDYDKLTAPDWGHEQFNPRNPDHVRYAERDSEGLYHALETARRVVLDNFMIDLAPTVGNMGIKIFQRHIPRMVECWSPPMKAMRAVRDAVMRGGYCYCVQRYRGPVWKYDINQAYAAAMREARLPSGRCLFSQTLNPYADAYIARVSGKNPHNRIPFYYRDLATGESVFGLQEIGDTWLTSIEITQLKKEGWKLTTGECWFWDSRFSMKEYVDKLEFLRVGEGRDPKSAQGEMVKSIGNNSYGKTVERLDGLELVMAAEQPEDFHAYTPEDDGLQYIWFRFGGILKRDYHQPQIGSFITAHVRMVVRRAALLNPDAFLYADTDCVMFRSPVALDVDPKRYGAWKIEAQGEEYKIAAKKVYTSADGKTRHAKGLNVRHLTDEDFDRWLTGIAPTQTQVQRQNFVKVISGFEMFVERTKVGERKSTSERKTA